MVRSILAVFDITLLKSVAAAILLKEYLSDFLFDMDAGIGHLMKSHGTENEKNVKMYIEIVIFTIKVL